MSVTFVGKNGRVYQRKFDHEEAQRRYAAGELASALAREYGVTRHAVASVVSDRTKATRRRYEMHVKLAGVCERCSAPTNLAAQRNGSRFCRDCASDNQATSVGDGVLMCFKCREWKLDDDFPHTVSGAIRRRGRHSFCRACQTKARQEYRERRKVPCVVCGKPALPPNEKTTRGALLARCRECYHESLRVQAGPQPIGGDE